MKTLLLDTDACIEIIRGNTGPMDPHPDAGFLVSWISGFEILSGLKGKRSTKKEKRAHAFLKAANVLEFGEEAATRASEVRIFLEKNGMKIGAYDTLLAGHALSLDIPLLTGNLIEFERVPGLRVISWHR